MLDVLAPSPPDPILRLIDLFEADGRPFKLDLGVGIYRDEGGRTPVFAAVKQAEDIILSTQLTKSYLGPEGDREFVNHLAELVFGAAGGVLGGRLAGLQTPGGTAAVRLGFELVAATNPDATVFLGRPSWPNHEPIIRSARLLISEYAHADHAKPQMRLDEMMSALASAKAGDVLLLHGCCHNPTGSDLSLDQWSLVANETVRRGVLPFVDMAYQGLGEGLVEDAAGLRVLVEHVPQALVAVSCSKNVGLYRERTGALFLMSPKPEAALSNVLALARAMYSMPPDHGAAVVRTILSSPELRASWEVELAGMRQRLQRLRLELAGARCRGNLNLDGIGQQRGMFSLLPLREQDVLRLQRDFGIYMPLSGRINIAGLRTELIPYFLTALGTVADTPSGCQRGP